MTDLSRRLDSLPAETVTSNSIIWGFLKKHYFSASFYMYVLDLINKCRRDKLQRVWQVLIIINDRRNGSITRRQVAFTSTELFKNSSTVNNVTPERRSRRIWRLSKFWNEHFWLFRTWNRVDRFKSLSNLQQKQVSIVSRINNRFIEIVQTDATGINFLTIIEQIFLVNFPFTEIDHSSINHRIFIKHL